MRTEDLRRWDALVVMSGDGLIHEVRPSQGRLGLGRGAGVGWGKLPRLRPPVLQQVVNGLMERPDWETAIQKPLCSLPAGSGNAVAASLNHYAG